VAEFPFFSNLLTLAKISQVLKTINAGFVPVAPAKVQRVATDNREIIDLNFVRYGLRLQRPLSRPFVHALGAWTGASQRHRVIIAHPLVAPGDPQVRVAFLRNLSRLDCLPFLGNVSHFVFDPSLTVGLVPRLLTTAHSLPHCSPLTDFTQRRFHRLSSNLPVRGGP
jgi:hypothetical protein